MATPRGRFSICVKTGKIRYRSRLDADIALVNIWNKSDNPNREEQRCYKCPLCKGWHLTRSGRFQ